MIVLTPFPHAPHVRAHAWPLPRPCAPPGTAGYLSQDTRANVLQATSAALDAITSFKQQFLQAVAPADDTFAETSADTSTIASTSASTTTAIGVSTATSAVGKTQATGPATTNPPDTEPRKTDPASGSFPISEFGPCRHTIDKEGWCRPHRDWYKVDSAAITEAQCTAHLNLTGIQGISFAPVYHGSLSRCIVYGHAADEDILLSAGFEKSFGTYGEGLSTPIASADLNGFEGAVTCKVCATATPTTQGP